MRKLHVLGVIALAAIGLTAACGGETEPRESASGNPAVAQPAPAKPGGSLNLEAVREDPCQLVTKAEAEAIFGRPAEAPSKGMAVGAVEATCGYAVATTRPSEVRTMTVSVMFSPGRVERGMDGRKFMENARKGLPESFGNTEPVSGLADEAFCMPGTGAATIFARAGDVVITVGGNTDGCAVNRQFAEKALARL